MSLQLRGCFNQGHVAGSIISCTRAWARNGQRGGPLQRVTRRLHKCVCVSLLIRGHICNSLGPVPRHREGCILAPVVWALSLCGSQLPPTTPHSPASGAVGEEVWESVMANRDPLYLPDRGPSSQLGVWPRVSLSPLPFLLVKHGTTWAMTWLTRKGY